jgi:hypothetical protein
MTKAASLLAGAIILGSTLNPAPTFANPPMSETAAVTGDWGVWSGWYWPFNAALPPTLYSDDEALARYDAFAGSTAQSWELNHHGPALNQPDWAGHCHAWAGASVWESMPTAERSVGGVTFRPRDLAALMTEAYYNDTQATEVSLFRPSPGMLWRYLRQEIKGVNPMHGHAMALIGNLTMIKGQVWNFPIYQYEVQYSQDHNGTCSGTVTLWFADDGNPAYADNLALSGATVAYNFSGVTLDGTGAPLDSGSWAGNDPTLYPTSIWRPYYAATWADYLANPALDGQHLAQILDMNNLGGAVNAAGSKWSTGGNGSWFVEYSVTHDGQGAAQSGAIGNSQASSIQTTVAGQGTVSFWEKVSSLAGSDYLRFYVDGREQPGSISGEVGWRAVSFTISTPGNHTLSWVYAKDATGAAGSDCAWIDQVTWQAGLDSAKVLTTPSPSAGGATSGDVTVTNGTMVTVCASPNIGCQFAGWTENGQLVSTSPCYSFQATQNRNLIANFAVSPPRLNMMHTDGKIVLSWGTDYSGYHLQSSTNLADAAAWQNVDVVPQAMGGQWWVTNSTIADGKYFRLKSP